MQEFIYRTGTTNDIEKIVQLGLNSFGQFKDHLSDINWKKLEAYLVDENTYPELLSKSKCFICAYEDEIIGMAFLVPSGNPTDIFQKDWSYLRMVGVSVKYAGNGIGRKLTQLCIDYAKETNETTVALHTSEFMDAARHIYESMGFNKVKELELRLGKRYWLYLLEL
jgi:ribosomal protein S18 acetylase RimI-like enzyme